MTQLLPYLEITHPDGEKQTLQLKDTSIKIGRLEGNDIVLRGDRVSQWHGVIDRSPEGYWCITDPRSTNGTCLKRNEQIIDIRNSSNRKEFLSGDDEIQIQDWRIVFKDPFKTNSNPLTDTIKNPLIPNVANGYVFCVAQLTLYKVIAGDRKEISGLRPKLIDLLEYLAKQNLANNSPVVCTYAKIAESIWKDNDHGAEDVQGLARELRQIIGEDKLETKKQRGYILHIHCEE